MTVHTSFSPEEIKTFEPVEKVGLLATINAEGEPHVSLITTLQAKTPTEVIWGQFTEGLSKRHVLDNPHTAFLILTLDRQLWRGRALYRRFAKEGEDYTMMNEKPMFRYNTYFGIHTVHYMDLVDHTGRAALPLARIVPASILTRLAKSGAKTSAADRILNPWSEALINRLDALKFLVAVGDDGFPWIVPLLQCQAADSRRLAFSTFAYNDELKQLKPGATVTVLSLTMQMESVLTRGVFRGFDRHRLVELGTIDIDWVYNSMPPKMGQIYPPVPVETVVDFAS
ncbi:MAG: hypothetical protein P9L99_07300 [Candidatus Lernaella stagnicola]|nr:hypothetical protein [Candidatus Lernaella stagnicola]